MRVDCVGVRVRWRVYGVRVCVADVWCEGVCGGCMV